MTEGLRLAVEALDKKFGPLWDERINLDSLEMMSLSQCILGQLGVNHWSQTVLKLVGWPPADASVVVKEEHPYNWFANHTNDWQNLIRARRAERASCEPHRTA